MSGDADTLHVMEIVLTADIFNRHSELDINDLTPQCREIFSSVSAPGIKRPVSVSEGMLKRSLGIPDAHEKLGQNPFVSFEEFGQRLKLTALEPGALWFLKHGGRPLIDKNPALAFYFEKIDSVGVSYAAVRAANPPFEDTKGFLDTKISKLVAEDEKLRTALDLVIINSPDEVEQRMEDLVCTPDQTRLIAKIRHAIEHQEFLHRHRIYEIGKLLFVGPPGTGKTSLALAMSRTLHMPVLEVRLSMVTSQYLGETSKNIDRIFELAKKLSPSILFVDEFDFVAKSRVADDHGAMKRAVNSLLKNIDRISLVKNGVLLIAATNHPQLLDLAAWRRFDEVVEFSLPNEEMRREILKKVTASITCSCDYSELAAETDGFSGADLRLMIKEAMLSALMDRREAIDRSDIERGIIMVKNRDAIQRMNWL
jgi:SpoVK/Ycf46/Vps4 family AAA+-type ATPase